MRLLFLFQGVMGRELEFLDVTRATKPERLPVVLSRPEIAMLLPRFEALRRLMFLIMYGAGLRHRECRRLRVKDVCFDEGHIVVRNGKGDQDRITVLPERCREAVGEQIERVRRQHRRDLDAGFGAVYLPYALERKYPNENREFGWQWVFPSRQMSKDPRSGDAWGDRLAYASGFDGARLRPLSLVRSPQNSRYVLARWKATGANVLGVGGHGRDVETRLRGVRHSCRVRGGRLVSWPGAARCWPLSYGEDGLRPRQHAPRRRGASLTLFEVACLARIIHEWHWVARPEPPAMGVVCINLPMPRRWPEAQGRATPFQRVYGGWGTNVLNDGDLRAIRAAWRIIRVSRVAAKGCSPGT